MREKSRELAFCGVSAALSVVLLLLSGLIPGATFCAPVLGMLPLLPVLSEFGWRPALGVYAVSALLAGLLAPDKEMVGVFLFLGYYPVLRPALERLRPKPLRLLAKLAVFNVSVLVLYLLLIHLFGLAGLAEEFAGYSGAFLLGLLAMGNVTFLLLDVALGRLTVLWARRLRRRFFQ